MFFDLDDTLFDRSKAQVEVLHLIVAELHEMFSGIEEKRILEAFLESDEMRGRLAYSSLFFPHIRYRVLLAASRFGDAFGWKGYKFVTMIFLFRTQIFANLM